MTAPEPMTSERLDYIRRCIAEGRDAGLASVHRVELLAEVDRLAAELEIAFGPSLYCEIQQVLDSALGTNETDGAGAGIVADITLVAERLANAENRLILARNALLRDGYFTRDQIGPDIAPRIVERLSAARGESETLRQEVMHAATLTADARVEGDRLREENGWLRARIERLTRDAADARQQADDLRKSAGSDS